MKKQSAYYKKQLLYEVLLRPKKGRGGLIGRGEILDQGTNVAGIFNGLKRSCKTNNAKRQHDRSLLGCYNETQGSPPKAPPNLSYLSFYLSSF